MASLERKLALKILNDIEDRGAFSNIALANAVKGKLKADAGFIRNLVYGVLEDKLLLDYFISRLVRDGGKRLRTAERNILRMGIYQLRSMDSVPDYAGIDESVDLAKEFARGKEGLVNAVLRNYLRKGQPDFPEDLSQAQRLALEYSFGQDIVSLWIEDLGLEGARAMMEASNKRPEIVIRANLSKMSRQELADQLRAEGFEVKEGQLAQTSLIVDRRQVNKEITDSRAFKEGKFSVQDEASQWLAQQVEARPGERIIDVCAAPGGKSLAMAEAIADQIQAAGRIPSDQGGQGKHGDQGTLGELGQAGQVGDKTDKADKDKPVRTGQPIRIEARDLHANKLKRLTKEAKRLGIGDLINVAAADARQAAPENLAAFDKVLADLPCSGLGVISRRPELKYNKKKEDFVALSKLQLEILNNVSKFVKPGGLLVYSTCTVDSLENQDVLDSFLEENEDFEREWQRQLLPTVEGCDGFFAAALRKELND